MNKKVISCDVAVIYPNYLATSVQNLDAKNKKPFNKKDEHILNCAYQYFFSICKKKKLSVVFTTLNDINKNNLLNGAWRYDKKWKKDFNFFQPKVIFSRCSPKNKQEKEIYKNFFYSSRKLALNDPTLTEVFEDKFKTYQIFKKYAIPTASINYLSAADILTAQSKLEKILQQHKNKQDFKYGFLIKDRFGTGGANIIKLDKRKLNKVKQELEVKKTVLQPFIKCDKGFVFGKYTGTIDLRVILIHNKIIQSYIRIARVGEFRANAQQGGNVVHISIKDVPTNVLTAVQKISKEINIKYAYYSLDFICSNRGNWYLVEGNASTGITWYNKRDEKKTKELIQGVVGELAIMKADVKS